MFYSIKDEVLINNLTTNKSLIISLDSLEAFEKLFNKRTNMILISITGKEEKNCYESLSIFFESMILDIVSPQLDQNRIKEMFRIRTDLAWMDEDTRLYKIKDAFRLDQLREVPWDGLAGWVNDKLTFIKNKTNCEITMDGTGKRFHFRDSANKKTKGIVLLERAIKNRLGIK